MADSLTRRTMLNRPSCARQTLSALALMLLFIPASTAWAGSGTPAVIANSEGIAVGLSNFTQYSLESNQPGSSASLVGPGWPYVILPFQHTGTNLTMRGGPASGGLAYVDYTIMGAPYESSFRLNFTANTVWDFEAAGSLLLHAAKKKASKSVKKSLKDSAKEGEEAAGAEDGVTEIQAVYKLIKAFAKLFGALDPTFVMNFAIENNPSKPGEIQENSCISKSQNTPGPAAVVIIGPPGEVITAATVDRFFVVSAGSSNQFEPGFVDLGVNSLCGYVCANWNATLDHLNETSQSDCENAQVAGSTDQANYDEILDQNSCLSSAYYADGVTWVGVPEGSNTYNQFRPASGCAAPLDINVDNAQVGLCGECPPVEASDALGPWSESCDETYFGIPAPGYATVLDAYCSAIVSSAGGDSARTVFSSGQNCATGHWANVNGTLECQPVPGSWAESCTFTSFSGITLCATCTAENQDQVESCQPCAGDEWYNFNGKLLCDKPPETASLPAASRLPSAWPQKTPPDPEPASHLFAMSLNPHFETMNLGAGR
jgi:hypothetical protein